MMIVISNVRYILCNLIHLFQINEIINFKNIITISVILVHILRIFVKAYK